MSLLTFGENLLIAILPISKERWGVDITIFTKHFAVLQRHVQQGNSDSHLSGIFVKARLPDFYIFLANARMRYAKEKLEIVSGTALLPVCWIWFYRIFLKDKTGDKSGDMCITDILAKHLVLLELLRNKDIF